MFTSPTAAPRLTAGQRQRALAVLLGLTLILQVAVVAGSGSVRATRDDIPRSQCTLYGVFDEGSDNSKFFKLNLTTGAKQFIGPTADHADVESLDTHPETGAIYGIANGANANPPAPRLVTIDRATGFSLPLTGPPVTLNGQEISFELNGASFHPGTKELWVGAANKKLYTINLTTGALTHKKSLSGSGKIEALAWSNDGTTLSFWFDGTLSRYVLATDTVSDSAALAEVEGLEFDDRDNLIAGFHGDKTMYFLNTATGTRTDSGFDFFDDVETLTVDCPELPPPPLTTLTVTKHVTGGTARARDWTMHIGTTVTFPGSEVGTITTVDPGTYTVSEGDGPTGYALTFGGDCNAEGSVTLDTGNHKTCTLTNALAQQPHGQLTVHKLVDTDGNGSFESGDDVANDLGFRWGLDGGTTNRLMGSGANDLSEGTHHVNENAVLNYHFVGWFISGNGDSDDNHDPDNEEDRARLANDTAASTDDDDDDRDGNKQFSCQNPQGTTLPVTFSIGTGGEDDDDADNDEDSARPANETPSTTDDDDGDHNGDRNGNVTVTLCNAHDQEQSAQLTVIKHVVGGDAQAADWTMHIGDVFSFPGSEQGTTKTVVTDTYQISETGGPAGFHLSFSGDCDSSGHVTVTTGSHKTCTLVNTRDTGTLIITKDVIGVNGEPLTDDHAFALTIGGTAATVRESAPVIRQHLPVGTITVNESPTPGYALVSYSLDQDGNPANGAQVPITTETTPLRITNRLVGGSVQGTKWNDLDRDGVRDGGEPGLANWTIELRSVCPEDDDCSTVSRTTTTDAHGHYAFTDVSPGTYLVLEHQQAGWVQTFPGGNGQHGPVTLAADQARTDHNFGNHQLMANLTVTKTDGLASTQPGRELTYTIVVRNDGEATAVASSLADTLPPQATYLRSTSDGANAPASVTANPAGDVLTWSLGDLAAGAQRTALVTVKLDDVFPNGTTTLTNVARVATSSAETRTDDNEARDETTVPAAPTIAITKSDAPDPVVAGTSLTYTLTWSVGGNAAATNVVVTDPLPANTTFVSASNGGTLSSGVVTWTLGTQQPGATGTLTLVVRVNSPLATGTVITNTATIDSTENQPVSATATTTIQSGPILSIAKTENVTDFANPGQTVTYTITVTNAAGATDTARGVVVTDTLPAGLTFDDGTTNKTFAAFDLAPGATQILTVNARVLSTTGAGTFVNTAKARGSNTPEVTATAEVPVRVPLVAPSTTEARLKITKTVNQEIANPGQILRYVVTIENISDVTAVNVRVTDTLQEGLTLVETGLRTQTFPVSDLTPGQKFLLTYEVKVAKAAEIGRYTNLAVARADNADPVTAQASFEVRKIKILASTGAGLVDALIALGGVATLIIGISLWRRRNHGDLVA